MGVSRFAARRVAGRGTEEDEEEVIMKHFEARVGDAAVARSHRSFRRFLR
jgi:hypothetical protein